MPKRGGAPVRWLQALEWIASLAGLSVYVALIVLTYRRLRDTNLSGWWIVLMICLFLALGCH